MSRHVIVISEDALVYEDLEYLRKLPNFARVWGDCSIVEGMRTVYPTITYPVHTSMRTGVYPARHGIVNNETPVMAAVSSTWHFMNDDVGVPDIFDAAKAAGLSTAAVFWPVTGRHASVDYLINEYWPQSPEQLTLDCFRESGSSSEVIDKVIAPNLHLIEGRHRVHPYCDEFITACACAMIRRYKPNLIMIHPANIDAYRHQSGTFSSAVTNGLHEIDSWLGQIIKATHDAGIYDETDFFIVSDHGQMDIRGFINLNVPLADAGFIDMDAEGNIVKWRAFSKSAALSAQVYLSSPADVKTHDDVYELLCRLRDEGIYGIERVYTAEEARREEGLSGDFSFVVEGNGIYSFGNDWRRPLMSPTNASDYKFGVGTHGYHPDKGPQPPLIAFGPDIKPGVTIPRRPIVDEAPTFARALGIELPEADGKVIEEIFK